ncbi:TonB-dependent receptor [Hymenobacter sp. H14-R3]|uniref:SusC/RagA family TonB-linked outer membrane protein n=1 Tax=Hymenobacter sp. H14-R3 TaxID=3046308 RepID=UPI0024BA6D31|nr:TonB-dependent receptor [Hymenobacter sp. H14-R3]MDJ0367488.1 TonB-dependent receptor [Hymenobacter sp. H14-R3]
MKKHVYCFAGCFRYRLGRGLVAGALATLAPGLALAQQATRTVGGTVRDETNSGLPGVTVLLKGTTTGATTDATGRYSLTIPAEGGTLTFSSVGYTAQSVALAAGRTTVDLQLAPESQALNDVVVVGYGTQKRSDLTGSVVSINKDRLTQLPNTNIAQALQGAIPGLSVINGGGGAEQGSPSILIRGRSSITANTGPLIILDGIPYTGSISDINPSDVESIEVLKDASAAAIYGSRGSNGVILVTTKHGKAGQVRVSYDGFYGFQQIINKPKLLDGSQFYAFVKNRANIPPTSIAPSEQALYDAGQSTDWYKEATRIGHRSQHSIGLSGGSEKATFYVGATYLDVGGVAINDNYKRYTLRPNVTVQIKPWLNFTSASQLSLTDRSGNPADFGGEYGANFFIPLATPYNPDGSIAIYAWPEYNLAGNPLGPTLASNTDRAYRTFSNNSLRVDIPFVPGLNYRLNTGVEFENRTQETYYGRDTRTGYEGNGIATNQTTQNRNFTVENIVNYNRDFGKHTVGVTALYSTQSSDGENQQLTGKGFPADVLTNFQMNAAALLTPTASYNKQNLLSQMVRLNYGYNSRYLLTFTARRDGYSGFGVDTKHGTFPSVAVGWNIANENFMKSLPVVNLLKLRLSYGLNGNQAVDPYQSLATFGLNSYLLGGTVLPGYTPSRLGNPKLSWESTRTVNVGLDFGFFNNRLQGSVDVYQKNTSDLLLRRVISSVQGFNSIVQNIGKTQNRGIEVGLTSTNLSRNGLTWTTSLNAAYNRNRIVDLYGDGNDDINNGWFIGQPISIIYGYKYDGIFHSADEVAASAQPTSKPGYVRVADVNGDGKISALDRTVQGNTDPRYTFGLTNTVTYRGFSLLVFIQGIASVTKENPLEQDGVYTDARRNTTRKDWWTPDNPNAAHWANDNNANLFNVNIYQNGSFARLKDVSLAYNFSTPLMERLHLANLKVYVTGRNLATVTSYKGLDPELLNQSSIPLQREFVGGLTVGF